MKMIFLIDGDNNIKTGLNGVELLSEEDTVLIFHSRGMALSKIKSKLNGCKANIQYIESVKAGRNSLDFQIIAELGVLIGKNEVEYAYVISQDQGYLASIEALKKRYSNAFHEVELRSAVEDCLKMAFLLKAQDKAHLNAALIAELGAAQGQAVYEHLKSLFAQPGPDALPAGEAAAAPAPAPAPQAQGKQAKSSQRK